MIFHRTLFSFSLLSTLVLPLAANPVSAEGYFFSAESLSTEWHGKPPEGCDPADPSTCRNEDRREDSNRDKPDRSDSR
jgi:hypothetical protein